MASDPILKTAEFFTSADYMAKTSASWSDVRAGVDFDTLNQGVESLFNPFTTFRYSEYILDKYDPTMHFLGYMSRNKSAEAEALNNLQNSADNFSATTQKMTPEQAAFYSKRLEQGIVNTERRKALTTNTPSSAVSNPTAKTLIEWGAKASSKSLVGFQPYTWTDFSFCKYYGKIPNNRLVTLRRYPFPVSDSLKTKGGVDLIPIAQAVTWFGGETGNTLTKMGNFSWDMAWKELEVKEQDIDGNEILASDLIKLVGGIVGKQNSGKIENTLTTLMGAQNLINDPKKAAELSGMDAKMQEYIKGLYKENGPYWNRVFGPVNVISKTTRRDRGMQAQYNTPITINFHYTFRSFSGLAPKTVALDLISNFMQLSYNNAQFLGQLSRYFPKTGLKFDPTTTQLITDVLIGWGMGSYSQADVVQKIQEIAHAQAAVFNETKNNLSEGDAVDGLLKAGGAVLNAAFLKSLSDAMPKLISVRSALSDAPVGEWHLTVGNPLNPIFVMGDLVMSSCVAKFDDEIGPDDFPTGITFTVQLKQGKPRDKVAIERMFNGGTSPLASTRVRVPSSANDTFNTTNNTANKTVESAKPIDVQNLTSDQKKEFNSNPDLTRVRRAYGYNSPGQMNDTILYLYFKKDLPSQ